MKYKCTVTSGGGTEYDAGVWTKKETDKRIEFTQDEEVFWQPVCNSIRINKYSKGRFMGKPQNDGQYFAWFNNGHVIRDWKDGTYTAYPNQAGTPYYFEPLV